MEPTLPVPTKPHDGVKSFEGPAATRHWPNFFGLPLGGELALKQQVDPYSRIPRETLHLPEVYKGHNPYLTQVMIEFITEEQLTPIRVILPLRETLNESTIVWDEYNFNNALLGPVPEEGVSRLVTQQISERQDHYVRGGLAFMIEHGFWQSEKGKQNYILQLTQIKNATLDGLYIGVLESLLTCKNVSNYAMQQLGNNSNDALMRSLKLEVEAFAEVQKNPNGWDMLNSRAHKALKGMGYQPDCWVVDEGTKRYIAMIRPENSQYLLGGPEGRALYNSALPAASNPKLLDQRTGCLIFETKSFESPDAKEPVNPMSRPQSIGEYNFSGPFFPVTRTDPYSSATRTICIYDESRDGWAYISLAEGLKRCGLFDEKIDAVKLFDERPETPEDPSGRPDIFKCKINEEDRGARYIGDVSDGKRENENGECTTNALSDEAVSDWANSVIYGLDAEMESSLRDLQDIVKSIENDITLDGSSEYLRAVAEQVESDGLDDNGLVNLPKVVEKLNEKGTPLKCMPHGFSSCAGLEYLCNDHIGKTVGLEELHAQVKPAMRAFNRLCARLESVCYDNVFFRESSAPDYYRKKEVKYALFSNLFHVPQPAMIFKNKTGNLCYDESILTKFRAETKDVKFYDMVNKATTPEAALIMAFNPANVDLDNAASTELDTEHHNALPGESVAAKVVLERLASQLMAAMQTAMLTQAQTLEVAKAFACYLGRCRFKAGNFFNKDTPKLSKFLMFVDSNTSGVPKYEKFKNFFNALAADTPVLENASENWATLATVGAEQEFFLSDRTPSVSKTGTISAMVAGKAIMNYIFNDSTPVDTSSGTAVPADTIGSTTVVTDPSDLKEYVKNSITFTRDYTDRPEGEPVRSSAFGHDEMSGRDDYAQKRRRLLLIAANPALGNLPATLGGAAFSQVAAMPGELQGTFEQRFNFSDDAATQRAFKDTHYPQNVFNRHSDEFQRRFNDLNQEPEILTRIVKQALLGVPLTQKALQHFIARDVVFPFNMLYFRPYMTYEMSSGVCLKCGAGTGETLVGQSDFQMGDDVQRKVHFGHYTIKYKSVVYNHRAVYHAYNYMCTGYIGGNDARFVTEHSEKTFDSTRDLNNFHSMYACLVPYQREVYCNPMARFSTVIENTGHWGRNVYPGVGKVRAGLASAINQVSYNDAYGGAAQQSHTTF